MQMSPESGRFGRHPAKAYHLSTHKPGEARLCSLDRAERNCRVLTGAVAWQLDFDLDTIKPLLDAADKLSLLPLLRASEAACQKQLTEDRIELFATIGHRLHLDDLHQACNFFLIQTLEEGAADCSNTWKW